MSERTIKAYADLGSHGHIFEFCGGRIADDWPHLMHVFSQKITPDLKEITITYEVQDE